jgi:cytochrome c biogenesis protein CcdA
LGLGFTLINLFVGLAAVLVAMSIVKYGVRATFIAGSALICLGSLFMGLYASKPWHYLIPHFHFELDLQTIGRWFSSMFMQV